MKQYQIVLLKASLRGMTQAEKQESLHQVLELFSDNEILAAIEYAKQLVRKRQAAGVRV